MEAKRGASQGRRQPGGRGKLTAEEKGTIWRPAPQSFSTNGKDTTGRKGSPAGAAFNQAVTKPHGHRGLRRTVKWKRIFLRIERQLRVHKSKRRLKCKKERTEKQSEEVTDSKISGLLAPDASLS